MAWLTKEQRKNKAKNRFLLEENLSNNIKSIDYNIDLFRFNITDRNAVHIGTSKAFRYHQRPKIFEEVLLEYPSSNFYHFLEKV